MKLTAKDLRLLLFQGLWEETKDKWDGWNLAYCYNKLKQFGWQAICVRGFIPPQVFMEFQSLRILPIAADMRSHNHLTYTPAPDIVHEAAGHSPMIADSDYAKYLKYYGKIAHKAIFSSEDYNLYVTIRNLSDIKENPQSTQADIKKSEDNLKNAIEAISYISEAAYLSRINWWTVEYGLIGDINNPKIYGAGLLSSIGESENCLKDKVEKIPLIGLGDSEKCIYEVSFEEQGDTLFTTISGEGLNSYGDSKLFGSDGFQQSLLKSLYRSLEDKRKKICEDYGELIVKCGSVVVQDIPKQVEPKVVKTNESIKIISLFSFVGVINNFIRLNITLRLLKTNDYKIVNKKFVLNVSEYKNKDPEGILLVFDNVNFESIRHNKLRDCANKYKMHWLLAKEDDG